MLRPGHVDLCSTVLRGGGIGDERSVLFSADEEVVTLSHTALDRGIFARGALAAARWLPGRAPGEYYMRGSVANISIVCEETFLHLSHAVLASKFCARRAMTSVSALGPIPRARSTIRASPRTSPVRLKMAARPLRKARMTSKPLFVGYAVFSVLNPLTGLISCLSLP